MKPKVAALFAACLVAGITMAALDAGAQSKCLALKYKAAGRAALARALCTSTAAKNGTAVDPACITKADARLVQKWTKAEKKGDCPAPGDPSAIGDAAQSFVDAAMDAIEPMPAVCCESGGSCWQGAQFVDAASCVQFGGIAGEPGTVCDGASGGCITPPASSGQCCYLPDFEVCNGGPVLDLAGCVSAGGLDYPFSATCEPAGFCSFGP